eukprot:Rmarinus@m.23399
MSTPTLSRSQQAAFEGRVKREIEGKKEWIRQEQERRLKEEMSEVKDRPYISKVSKKLALKRLSQQNLNNLREKSTDLSDDDSDYALREYQEENYESPSLRTRARSLSNSRSNSPTPQIRRTVSRSPSQPRSPHTVSSPALGNIRNSGSPARARSVVSPQRSSRSLTEVTRRTELELELQHEQELRKKAEWQAKHTQQQLEDEIQALQEDLAKERELRSEAEKQVEELTKQCEEIMTNSEETMNKLKEADEQLMKHVQEKKTLNEKMARLAEELERAEKLLKDRAAAPAPPSPVLSTPPTASFSSPRAHLAPVPSTPLEYTVSSATHIATDVPTDRQSLTQRLADSANKAERSFKLQKLGKHVPKWKTRIVKVVYDFGLQIYTPETAKARRTIRKSEIEKVDIFSVRVTATDDDEPFFLRCTDGTQMLEFVNSVARMLGYAPATPEGTSVPAADANAASSPAPAQPPSSPALGHML